MALLNIRTETAPITWAVGPIKVRMRAISCSQKLDMDQFRFATNVSTQMDQEEASAITATYVDKI